MPSDSRTEHAEQTHEQLSVSRSARAQVRGSRVRGERQGHDTTEHVNFALVDGNKQHTSALG
jgi:hypothetical protein